MCESVENHLNQSQSQLILVCRFPDAYHSCYILAGLSSTQYFHDYAVTDGTGEGGTLSSAMHWISSPRPVIADRGGEDLIDEEDKVAAVHPIYVIPWSAVDRCHTYFSQKQSF